MEKTTKRKVTWSTNDKNILTQYVDDLKPKSEDDWSDIAARGLKNKFSVDDLKSKATQLGLKYTSNTLTPSGKKCIEDMKEIQKELAKSGGKMPRKGTKKRTKLDRMFGNLIEGVPVSQAKAPTKRKSKSELEKELDADDKFIHEAIFSTQPKASSVNNEYSLRPFKVSRRQWCPTLVMEEIEDVGDDFSMPYRERQLPFSESYFFTQVAKKDTRKAKSAAKDELDRILFD